jgi:hypothetical protein
MSNDDMPNIPVDTLAQTENYTVWSAVEPDEKTYHVELGAVTVHFFGEEWDEFVTMIRQAAASIEAGEVEAGDEEEEDVVVELDWGTLYFQREEWEEFLALIDQID